MGRKLEAVFFLRGGAGFPSNIMWPGPRPTWVPSGILIHLTVRPQYINVTDRQRGQDREDRRGNGPIVYGEPLYKRSLQNVVICGSCGQSRSSAISPFDTTSCSSFIETIHTCNFPIVQLSFYLPIVQLFYLVSLSNMYMYIVIDVTGI